MNFIPIVISEEHIGFDWFEPKKVAELLMANFPLELTEELADLQIGFKSSLES